MKNRNFFFSCSFMLSLAFAPLSLKAATQETEEIFSTVILGGGVGGLTSALYLSRAGLPPLVIEGANPGGALAQSPKVQNWPGELEIKGADLTEKMRHQAKANGAQFLQEEVIDVDLTNRPFTITTRSVMGKEVTHKIKAETVIVALGTNPRLLGIPGEKGEGGYWVKGVYTCAVCDGSLYKDKTVAVVGGGDAAITEAHYLSDIARKVIVYVRGKEFKTLEKARKDSLMSKPNVQIAYETSVKEIKGDGDNITHLLVQTGQKRMESVPVDGVFLAIGSIPNSAMFKNRLDLDKQGFIILKNQQETSVKGVYAIGDISDPTYQQAVSAAGDGAKAALQAQSYLSTLPLQDRSLSKEVAKAPAAQPQIEVIEITSLAQFNKEIKNSETPVVVDFYATWCGPCKYFAPIFDGLATTFSGKIKFLKVNIDIGGDISRQFQVKGIPTLIVFDKEGNVISKKTGTKEINELTTILEPLHEHTASQIESLLKQGK